MNSRIIEDFDNMMKRFGYKRSENNKCEIDPSGGAATNYCRNFLSDFYLGFQDLDPMATVVISEIIANNLSRELPSSILNAYGNWLQLIGQVIEVYIAQQQYQECGPGRFYNTLYRNVANPFCINPYPSENDGREHLSRKSRKKRRNKR